MGLLDVLRLQILHQKSYVFERIGSFGKSFGRQKEKEDFIIMKTWYYGVVYFKNGEASVSRPFDSKEKCIAAIEEGIEKHLDIVEATSYMTRTSEEPITTKKMFGCPKSRDLLNK